MRLVLGQSLQLLGLASGLILTSLPVSGHGSTRLAPVIARDRLSEGWWRKRHEDLLATIERGVDPEVLLIGDSITNNYDKASPPDEDFQSTWDTFYAPRRALNLGFSGDTTGNVLWRLRHGEVDTLHPKAAVLLIGTNDTGSAGRSAEETWNGIAAVVTELRKRLPGARILLLGLLPSAVSSAKSAADTAVNNHLAQLYEGNDRVTYLDVGSVLVSDSGALDTPVFYDPRLDPPRAALHPDTHGQHRMAEAVEPTLARLIGKPPEVALAAMTKVNTAIIAVPKLEQDSYDWFARHSAVLQTARQAKPEIVMIGDSITHFWGGVPKAAQVRGACAWDELFGDRRVLNLGFGWDRTQNVLWRLRHGELTGIAPRWIVINIGTNNLTGTASARANTPEETVAGIEAIASEVRVRAPTARVVIMGILPRGRAAGDPLRAPINRINALLAQRYAIAGPITFVDVESKFLEENGNLRTALMPDGTHPNEAGYRILAATLRKVGVAQDGFGKGQE